MIRRFPTALLLALLLPVPALAAGNAFQTWGPHVGFSSDPSQVVFGGHLEMGGIAPQVDFVPGVDVGLGDNATVVSINGDFRYRIKVTGATWQPYAGAGVAVHVVSVNDRSGLWGGNSTVAGGTALFGADVPTRTGNRFYVEGRIALGDGPSFKALAGWSFPLR